MTSTTPPDIDEIMLIQPNNVTFGQYQISEIQENVLTLIAEQLQSYMVNNGNISRDLFNQPFVEIVCDEAGGKNNKTRVKKEISKLIEKRFKFNWPNKQLKKEIETEGVIITTFHDIKQTNRVQVTFNPWAIPFLVYYGEGVGGTIFNKLISMKLRSTYVKRIYKILCSQRDRAEYFLTLDGFRERLGIPDSYDNSKIIERILDPAKEEINNSASDVGFEYELICRKPTKGRKPKADTIIFKIISDKTKLDEAPNFLVYNYVYRWLGFCFGTTSSKAQDFTDKLKETLKIQEVYRRAAYYDEQITKGKMTREHCQNALKKMLREEYGMK